MSLNSEAGPGDPVTFPNALPLSRLPVTHCSCFTSPPAARFLSCHVFLLHPPRCHGDCCSSNYGPSLLALTDLLSS